MSTSDYQKKRHQSSSKIIYFESLEEARHYQGQYGGTISILRKQELKIIELEDPLDFDIDNPTMISSIIEEDVNNYYIKYFGSN